MFVVFRVSTGNAEGSDDRGAGDNTNIPLQTDRQEPVLSAATISASGQHTRRPSRNSEEELHISIHQAARSVNSYSFIFVY